MIRAATSADLPVILEITNEAILNSTAIYEYDPWNVSRVEQWFSERRENGFPVVVIEENNEVIGFGSYGKFRARIGYRFTVEHSVYVKKGIRGSGYGSTLLNFLIERAQTENYHTMIGVIDATNEGSIEFHKKHGFNTVGTLEEVGYKFERRLSVTLMQRMLKP